MKTLLFNLNSHWDFDDYCRSTAPDWFVDNDLTVWDAGKTYEVVNSSWSWPTRVSADEIERSADLSDLLYCLEGKLAVFVAVMRAEDVREIDFKSGIWPVILAGKCKQRILILVDNDDLTEGVFNQLLEWFTFVAVVEGEQKTDRFLVLRELVDIAHHHPLEAEHHPFAHTLDNEALRCFKASVMIHDGQQRVKPDFNHVAAMVYGWAEEWLDSTDLNEEFDGLLSGLIKNVDELSKKSSEPADQAPEFAGTPVPLFYNKGFYGQLSAEVDTFKLKIDTYLEEWFVQIYERHENVCRQMNEQFDTQLAQLSRKLNGERALDTSNFDTAINRVNKKHKKISARIAMLISIMRSDLTPTTHKNVQTDRTSGGYQKPWFDQQEQAVRGALKDVENASNLLASRRAFFNVLAIALILASIPVAIMRWANPIQPYFGEALLLDAGWVGTLIVVPGIIMLVFVLLRRKKLRREVNKLKMSIKFLLQRHQEALQAADKYLYSVIAARQIYKIHSTLQWKQEKHQYLGGYVNNIKKLSTTLFPQNYSFKTETAEKADGTPDKWWRNAVTSFSSNLKNKRKRVNISDTRRSGADGFLWESFNLPKSSTISIKEF